VALAASGVLLLAGCAKMNAALGQQWLVVQFNSGTTMTTARHVTAACSHVPGVTLKGITPDAAQKGMVESARYNTAQASDSDMARIQECLGKFPSVLGVTLDEPGDY